MSQYVLYLDKSETFTSPNDRFFSVAGVIIENNDLSSITNDMDNLKKQLWKTDPLASNYILHEKEISEANKSGCTKNACYKLLFTDFHSIQGQSGNEAVHRDRVNGKRLRKKSAP